MNRPIISSSGRPDPDRPRAVAAPLPRRYTAWDAWLASPPGRYVLDWEQAGFDEAVGDVFGFHAVQLGLPALDCLRANRMPHRIGVLLPGDPHPDPAAAASARSGTATPQPGGDDCPIVGANDGAAGSRPADAGGAACPHRVPAEPAIAAARSLVLVEQFEELPFETQSIDLVVMPHVLEFAQDPHQVLREVDRVLRPEGRAIITGFNPISLWGARQGALRALARPFLPGDGHFIGVPRLRDWFKLLSFAMDGGRYGCYRPPCRTQLWLDRTRFMEKAGDRWWPICGAVYMVSAIKRVRGMRLIGPAWKKQAARVPVAVAAPQRSRVGAGARVPHLRLVVADRGPRSAERRKRTLDDGSER